MLARTPKDRLWAITCYYNPCGYRTRHENYRTFRDRLRAPLLAVEWSPLGCFELHPHDADILIQLSGGDVMWQKERLLNVALSSVPASCDRIAWLDSDILFEREDWTHQAADLLEQHALIQLFDVQLHLPRGMTLEEAQPVAADIASQSTIAMLKQGRASVADLARSDDFETGRRRSGIAWAARRDILRRHGFYDACVVGSGTRVMYYAALGMFENAVGDVKMTEPWAEHYLEWAEPFHADVRDAVGYLPGRVGHLWHGDIRDRRYDKRHEGFRRFDFDPRMDIALTDQGCWRWNSNKPDMHRYVVEYFRSRREDGTEPAAVSRLR